MKFGGIGGGGGGGLWGFLKDLINTILWTVFIHNINIF